MYIIYQYIECPLVFLILLYSLFKSSNALFKCKILFAVFSSLTLFVIYYCILWFGNPSFFFSRMLYIPTASAALLIFSCLFLGRNRLSRVTEILYYFAFYKGWKMALAPFYNTFNFDTPGKLYNTFDIITLCILILILLAITHLFRKYSKKPELLEFKSAKLLLFFPIALFVLFTLYEPFFTIPSVVLLSVFASVMLISLLLYYHINYSALTYRYEEVRLNTALLMAKEQLDHIKRISIAEEKVKESRHEIKNNYFYIQTLLKENKYDEIDKFLTKTLGELKSQREYVNTGHLLVDHILNAAIRDCKLKNIDVTTDILIPSSLNVNPEALSTVLMNLLHNAVEAEEKLTNPYINIALGYQNNWLIFKLSNRIDGNIDISNLKTTKKDTFNHGFGLKIVKRIVEKENGIFNASIDNGEFVATVMFPA